MVGRLEGWVSGVNRAAFLADLLERGLSMINDEKLLAMEKENLPAFSKTLSAADISQLVEWLAAKDDKLRYHSLLLLEHRSDEYNDVYPFWDIFQEKLKSDHSYQRSIGAMLIAANVKWDNDNKMAAAIGDYLKRLDDEKPITVRQCIQSLNKVIPYNAHILPQIADALMAVDISGVKPTMRKLILIDILNILVSIRRRQPAESVDAYIFEALTGGVLDKKSIRQIETML